LFCLGVLLEGAVYKMDITVALGFALVILISILILMKMKNKESTNHSWGESKTFSDVQHDIAKKWYITLLHMQILPEKEWHKGIILQEKSLVAHVEDGFVCGYVYGFVDGTYQYCIPNDPDNIIWMTESMLAADCYFGVKGIDIFKSAGRHTDINQISDEDVFGKEFYRGLITGRKDVNLFIKQHGKFLNGTPCGLRDHLYKNK